MNPIFSANWIKAKRNNKMAATDFWRSFTPKKDLVSGKLIITAHGVFTAYLNGQRVGEDILSPGWTVYQKRLQYLTYDVTAMLKKGINELRVGVGRGWFFHNIPEVITKPLKGNEVALICALSLR